MSGRRVRESEDDGKVAARIADTVVSDEKDAGRSEDE